MGVQPQEHGGGVWRFQSPLWQTNSVLVETGSKAVVLFDPAYTPEEIAAIRDHANRRGASVHVLITHADFDHICGIPYFPEAEIVAGSETVERLRSSAAEALKVNGPEWGIEWETSLRIDRIISTGEFECGGTRIVAIEASNHGRDGVAFALPEQQLLVAGDHVSAITYPLLADAIPQVIDANRAILEALDRYDLRLVVPGHGPAHSSEDTRAIAQADVEYLERLVAAADEANENKLPPGYALIHVFEVEPPRKNTSDFEIYSVRVGNAQLALKHSSG